jgi:competence protein ComGC
MNRGNAVRQQRGLSLIGLLFVGLIVVFLLLIGFKIVPAVTEYIAIEKAIRKINKDGTTVAQIRREFDNYAIIDEIKSITPKDLDITKENDRVVISYAYSYSIPIMDNVRLVIDFAGSTRTRSKSTP